LSVSDFSEANTGRQAGRQAGGRRQAAGGRRQAAGPPQLTFTRSASLDTALRRADLQNNPEQS